MDTINEQQPVTQQKSDALSEILTAALRTDTLDTLQSESPYAACLLPLLRSLGWNHYARELIEALPHFSDYLELVDLRNILVRLGYESMPRKGRLDQLSSELYPCLFVDEKDRPLVLLGAEGDQVRYFDASQNEEVVVALDSRKGCAYLFTHINTTHGQTVSAKAPGEWFDQLLGRFRGLFGWLLGMTFLINVIAMAVPLFIMMVYDKVIGAESVDALSSMAAGIALLLLSDAVLRYHRGKLLGTMAGRMDYLIGVESFRQILSLPPILTERSTMAAQLARLKQFDSVRDFFTGSNASILLDLPFIPLMIAVIAVIAGWAALVPVVMLILFLVFGLGWLPVSARRVLRTGQARNDKQKMLIQSLSGRSEIKGAAAEQSWLERFREYSAESATANYKAASASAVINAVSQAGVAIGGLAVLVIGVFSVMAGDMTVGALIASMVLISKVLSPIQQAFLSFGRFKQLMAAVKQINQLMKLEVEKNSRASSVLLVGLKGRVKIDRISFRYSPSGDPALTGVSLVAEPGEMVAITGDTGSGKSTLMKLIAGMYKPQAGSLTLDDQDIRQMNVRDLRRSIAYVPQNAQLFHGTIAQNIRMNDVLATDEDLHNVAKSLGILDDILALPQGFDTPIGDERTRRLTPGFVHGISMARAFVCSAQVVILDEPGAALDHEGDMKLVSQLRALKGKKTVLVVTHRPSHIRQADKVIVLEKGMTKFVGEPEQALQVLVGGLREGK
ncbi:ATP-binding cassette domain-containing protein [Pontibacterium granulatum]|uniref:peptidase domain-containing ABC transporter n=1 Tax=Pontibacterium granulatum TaxID=2036029 RepID=UPI00249B54B9|nr:ATP-binding cassette domain-containing protein [Pontibacterium granulatum]MDI3323713.1 ATP-binding cassette domain-containing protein [Pontibacterium granulatum]